MNDSHFSARCDSCAQEYRIPDADRTYACKHCDGQVRAVEIEETATCPHCEEVVSKADAFCGGCGGDLREAEEHAQPAPVRTTVGRPAVGVRSRRGRGGSRRSGRQGEERRQASHELVKAFGFLKTLRVFFRISIAFSVLSVPAILWMMSQNEGSMGGLLVSLGISVFVACVMLIGEYMLFFRPFFWSVLFACLVTLGRASDAYQRDFDIVWVVGGLLWAGVFWAFVPATARVRRLLEENPDLHISRLMLGIQKRGGDAQEFAEAQEQAERRAWTHSMRWSAGIVTVSVIFAVLIYGKYHRPPFSSAWEDFLVDWRGGDAAEIAEWFPESSRERQHLRLENVKENRGWGSTWPDPQDPEFLYEAEEERAEAKQVVEASFDDGLITWSFAGKDADWYLMRLELPAPPFDEVQKDCLRLWNSSNIDGVAGLFRDPSDISGKLKRSVTRLDWEELPHAIKARVQGGGGAREILLDTDAGTVMIRFRLRDDAWQGASIKLPRD